jgi:hypothetical protein
VHGVWQGCVVDGVQELHQYLVKYWNHEKCYLPLKQSNCRPIYCYLNYNLTAAEYDRNLQMQNTLRWTHTHSRLATIRSALPGFVQLELGVQNVIAQQLPELASGLGLHNGHILRQFTLADSGSGFCSHIDEADGCDATFLYLSVAVKLTADPDDGEGSWMQVEGFEPVRYGNAAGSLVMFLSRRPHRSLRTPMNMKHVYKIVLFYKFINPYLLNEFKTRAPLSMPVPQDQTHSTFPPQVCYRIFESLFASYGHDF